MRSRIKIVKDPMIIRAEIMEYRPSSAERLENGTPTRRKLKIKISTDKVQTQLMLDVNKTDKTSGFYAKKKLRYSFTKTPLWTNIGGVWCHRNKKTRYKDFLYILRNPHSAIMFLNSDRIQLKKLAEAIVKGYKIIFPRETRYYGNDKL
jgi:hypothetical protein